MEEQEIKKQIEQTVIKLKEEIIQLDEVFFRFWGDKKAKEKLEPLVDKAEEAFNITLKQYQKLMQTKGKYEELENVSKSLDQIKEEIKEATDAMEKRSHEAAKSIFRVIRIIDKFEKSLSNVDKGIRSIFQDLAKSINNLMKSIRGLLSTKKDDAKEYSEKKRKAFTPSHDELRASGKDYRSITATNNKPKKQ